MNPTLLFIIENSLLGAGLAMDAFSVSLANGLNEPCMKKHRMIGMAGLFAFFQAFMPLVGWICIHTVVQHFKAFEKFIPAIALILLAFIGSKMLYDGIKGEKTDCSSTKIGFAALLIQGTATSIDALSVGFTIAEYDLKNALLAALIIAAVTFVICMAGLFLGKKFGTKLSGKAQIFGGVILMLIGIEIFLTGVM